MKRGEERRGEERKGEVVSVVVGIRLMRRALLKSEELDPRREARKEWLLMK